jgi:hypothetical protein
MTQDALIILLFKVVLLADVVSIAVFIGLYTAWASWWRNPIGRTIVAKSALLALALLPSVLSLFWHFSRLTSHIAAWSDIVIFALIAVVMGWRCIVWRKVVTGPGKESTLCPP